jgi:hypothetical protein
MPKLFPQAKQQIELFRREKVRVDQPRGQFFYTNWTGLGGAVSASTYTV